MLKKTRPCSAIHMLNSELDMSEDNVPTYKLKIDVRFDNKSQLRMTHIYLRIRKKRVPGVEQLLSTALHPVSLVLDCGRGVELPVAFHTCSFPSPRPSLFWGIPIAMETGIPFSAW